MKTKSLTPSELKALHEEHNPESYFFTRKSMGFFGDTMRNYAVKLTEIEGRWYYELLRRRPVKYGLKNSAYFEVDTYRRVINPQSASV